MSIPGSLVKLHKYINRDKNIGNIIWFKRVSDASYMYGSNMGTYTEMLHPGNANRGLTKIIPFGAHRNSLLVTYLMVKQTLFIITFPM